jgi:DNA-binding transcriptional regulator YiaG/mRNA-degrading endonuclease RelE of RelBE toxin-antitoxin system
MNREWFEYVFIEFLSFERELKKLCSSEEQESKIKNFVAFNRHKGDSIGSSGLKKLRVPLPGRGTRGGGRIIYYFTDEDNAFILFMMIYSKSNQENLSHEEECLLKSALDQELKAIKKGSLMAYDVSREDLLAELKRDLENGTSLTKPAYKVRSSEPMGKDEFSSIRKEHNLTQAQLAEVLDISIKTVQAYEQGRAEIPGLVLKVLRLMRKYSVFSSIFCGEMSTEEYSKCITMKSIISSDNATIKLADTIIDAVEEHRTLGITNEIDTVTNIEDFVVLNKSTS